MNKLLKKLLCSALSLTLILTGVFVPAAQAAVIGSEAVLGQADVGAMRERVRDFFARDDVARQMQSLGVSAGEARKRVDAMTDHEVVRANGMLDRLPAGQDALGDVLGFALLVFIILLITDLLGLTHVFPFTKRR